MKLNQNPQMITLMESDLKQKVQAAIDANPDLKMAVHGIFSVDDLETKMEADLCGHVGVGVQYAGCTNTSEQKHSSNPAQGNTGRMVFFNFTVILAVPVSMMGDERYSATTLLSVLRMSIFGKPIAVERSSRTWEFISERPEVGASSTTMLYYAQVWQVAMQNLGTAA